MALLTTEEIVKPLLEGFLTAFYLVLPYFKPLLFSSVIVLLIGFALSRVVHWVCVVSGESQRETRRKEKRWKNVFDLVTTLSDIFPRKK